VDVSGQRPYVSNLEELVSDRSFVCAPWLRTTRNLKAAKGY
jgi:hypothetical protein